MLSTRLAPALLLAALAAPAWAQDVNYQITNDSGLTLMEFYTSVADEGNFGSDLLAAKVLAPGESGTVTIGGVDDQCDRDLRFIFEDGSEKIERANICDSASYTLTTS